MVKLVEKKLNNNRTTTSSELDKLGRKLFEDNWIGVMSADTVPKKIVFCKAKYSIVNLDDSSLGGSHWIAVICDRDNAKSSIYVYDSFGRKTSQLPMGDGNLSPLPQFIKQAKIANSIPEQKINESNCGQRSIGALLAFSQFGPKAFLEI